VVWAVLALDALAIFVTYSRVSPAHLYHVSREGPAGGLSRVLVDLNFPESLVAIAIAGVLLERGISRRHARDRALRRYGVRRGTL
jgi:hypothetical protein